MELIDKAAVVAEIERRIKTNKECMLGLKNLDYYQGKVDALNDTISFLDTLEVEEVDLGDPKGDKGVKYIIDTKALEVKEVDLEKEVAAFGAQFYWDDYPSIAKHFFELGIKVQKGK